MAPKETMFQKVHKYLEQVTPERPQVLREMEAHAQDKGFPIVGPLVGRLLYQLTLMTKAKRILELGSGFGYSAFSRSFRTWDTWWFPIAKSTAS